MVGKHSDQGEPAHIYPYMGGYSQLRGVTPGYDGASGYIYRGWARCVISVVLGEEVKGHVPSW